MRRTLFWILISLLTFALGVATAFVWLNRPNLTNGKFGKVSSAQEDSPSTQRPILAYCELANNPEKYDGQIVRVSARLWFMMHGYSFFNKNCDGDRKQAAVIFPNNERAFEIQSKIATDTGLSEYHPWGLPEIIAVGKFTRVEPSRAGDSVEDNTYLHFEILEVEKASKQ